MLETQRIERVIGNVLLLGTLISALIVLFGGILYLLDFGDAPMQSVMIHSSAYQIITPPFLSHLFGSPVYFIQAGLLLLVATQLLRVAILAAFYAYIRDRWFTGISLFVLLVLIVSNIWLN